MMTVRSLSLWAGGLAMLTGFLPAAFGQNGSVSGIVRDPSHALVESATVKISSPTTGWTADTVTNGSGAYSFPFVMRGRYTVEARAPGFTAAPIEVTVEVGGAVEADINLALSATATSVNVNSSPEFVNLHDGSVSTVTNRALLESMPLNGRTINSLVDLTPGVINAPSSVTNAGQFSVNGQRTDANYLTVDGVSANFGTTTVSAAQAGSQFALSALGGTNTLVSTDAIEEFRVYTSSFAPEYGRSPGGQFQISTRSGTNSPHGSLFEYFRNNQLDANDWFANSVGKPRAAERHNDFGGVVGGPIVKNRLFYFVSHESLFLRQPQAQVVSVPSEASRALALPLSAPLLKVFPIPDAAASNPNATTFTGTWSNIGSLHATSVRADYLMGSKVAWFARVNVAPSALVSRQYQLTTVQTTAATTSTVTLGAVATLTPRIVASAHFNFSQATYGNTDAIDNFGGATPIDVSQITNGLVSSPASQFAIYIAGEQAISGRLGKTVIPQFDYLGDIAFHFNRHDIKAGADWRRLTPDYSPAKDTVQMLAISGATPVINNLFDEAVLFVRTPGAILEQNVSTYVQDSWRVSQRLTLTYGVRWDVNPGVTGFGNTSLYAYSPLSNLSQATLQKVSSLWNTTWGNFAPRAGVAYRLTDRRPIVLRAGTGVFYDSASGGAAQVTQSNPPYAFFSVFTKISLPLTVSYPTSVTPPISVSPAFIPNLRAPYSLQWNVALESQITPATTIGATYLGQDGRDLLRTSALNPAGTQFSQFSLTDNSGSSSYEALQIQLRRRATRLNATANYTWAHSIDTASADTTAGIATTYVPLGLNRGSSDFDVRQSASVGVSYSVGLKREGLLGALFGGWAVSSLIQARGGFPINIFTTSQNFAFVYVRPDLVAGTPLWISDPKVATGTRLNPAAFKAPTTPRQGTLGRNVIYGPGLVQVDAGLTRSFNLTERVKLSVRGEAFNILNHPNFTNQTGQLGLPLFGISSSMLNQSLGGLTPLFQTGGPRSLQITARLSF